jgi:hypothetical protein
MEGTSHPGISRRFGVPTRIVLVVVAVVMVGLSIEHFFVRRGEDREVLSLIQSTGLDRRQPDLAYAITYDPDPVRAELAVARALLAESFDMSGFSRLPQREAIEAAARIPERLELARELAAQAWKKRPAAWQAPMIIGGATYRLWWIRGDPRLYSERGAWERPLREAVALAPHEDEPGRILAVAYVEIWPTLSPDEQQHLRSVLQSAFRDQRTFDLVAPTWFTVAADVSDAMSVVPDTVEAWTTVESVLRRRGDWADYAAVAARRSAALSRSLGEELEEILVRLRGGDYDSARAIGLSLIASTPPDTRWAETVERVIELLPPGPLDRPATEAWLNWGLEGFVRGWQWLRPTVVQRLASGLADLSRPTAALAALAAGDLVGAEIIERKSEALNTEPWAPYCIAKARVLLARGDVDEARRIFAFTQPEWRREVPALIVHRDLARAGHDGAEAMRVETALERKASGEWPGTSWRWRPSGAWMDILTSEPEKGLAITFDVVPPHGAVVEVTLDGEGILVAPIPPTNILEVPVSIPPGPHLLEVSSVAGQRAVPGSVSLLQ